MSFFAGKLCVVLFSTHLPISRAVGDVKRERLAQLIMFTDRELSKLLAKKVKIAVAGVNPHASVGGMFGTEVRVAALFAVRCNDTIFLRGYKGEFDAVVALYHDQATIAVKSLSFGLGVNVTLGLPLIRTSVDHGTAFDIAGKGIADASSMVEAVKLAARLAENSRRAS